MRVSRRDLFSGAAVVSVAGVPAVAAELRDRAYLGGNHQCGECLFPMLTIKRPDPAVYPSDVVVHELGCMCWRCEWRGPFVMTLECQNRGCSRYGILYRYPTVELERL